MLSVVFCILRQGFEFLYKYDLYIPMENSNLIQTYESQISEQNFLATNVEV